MSWYLLFTLVSFFICLIIYGYYLFKIISLGKPADFSEPKGKVGAAIVYSFTGGMSPKKKESAYLHLPTYTAGILYHLGTFLSILLFFIILLDIHFSGMINIIIAAFLIITAMCGMGILIKRMLKGQLRSFSNPDDYLSNLLVTGFQVITALSMLYFTPLYFVFVGIFLLYLPVGKLKHSVYFFAARYHLGFFYGRRNVWPPKI